MSNYDAMARRLADVLYTTPAADLPVVVKPPRAGESYRDAAERAAAWLAAVADEVAS